MSANHSRGVDGRQGEHEDAALIAQNLVKRYGELTAVNGVSFTVATGEIFGLLGPNGAGKTTTLEMLEGLRRPDEGTALVAGIDVRKHPRKVRERIGVQLQDAGLFERLTVAETLKTFAAFHTHAQPVPPLIERFNLTEKAKTQVEQLSGGQRQRLSIALALLNDPLILFLDEPTTGLDPQARRNLWDVIANIRDEGRTVVLTTHYMDEAYHLCDRIAIVDRGEVIALDTPNALIQEYASGAKILLEIEDEDDVAWLSELPAVERVAVNVGVTSVHTTSPEQSLPALFDAFNQREMRFHSLRIEAGSLEDVFLNLTGRSLRE